MAAESQRFVVIATPRSGSNWLCTLLDSHPAILCHHELFNPDGVHLARSLRDTSFNLGTLDFQREQPLELLRRAWAETLGHSHVGFKINIGQSPEVFSAVMDDLSVAKLLVSRKNRIRSYISECIAEDSGQWESYPESRPLPRSVPIRVDVRALEAHAARNFKYLAEIRAQLARRHQKAFEISYESIGHEEAHRNILRYLGADPDIPLEGQTRRMNPEPLRELIANYDDLADDLAGTELFSDLEAKETYE